MRQATIIVIFLTVFTTIYTLMHYYVFGRILGWLGISITLPIIIAISVMILSFPVTNLIAAVCTNKYSNAAYDVAAVWLGTVTVFLISVFAAEFVNIFAGPYPAAVAAISIGAGGSLFALYNANNIRVKEYTIKGNVKKKHKIAVASDIHAGPVHGKRYLTRILDLIKKEKPEMLFLPGDLVDGPGLLPDDVLEPLKDYNIPIFYSFGNHEQYVGEKHVERVLKNTGVTLLRDEVTTKGEIQIVAVDDREDKKALAKHFPKIDPKKYTILLYHRPDGLAIASKKGVDLMLSGHTHNGQIFPFNLLVRTQFANIRGWYENGKTKHFVSSGAGTWGPPMRLGSDSEVVIINIEPN